MKKILFIIMILLFPIMVNAAACDATSEIKEGYIPEGFEIGYYVYDENTNEFTIDHLEPYRNNTIIKYTETSNKEYYSLCDTEYYLLNYQLIKLTFDTDEKLFELITAKEDMNLLQYPSVTAPTILEEPIKKGTKLEVYTQNRGFAGVLYEGKRGWINYAAGNDLIMCNNNETEYILLTDTSLICDSYEDNANCKAIKTKPETQYNSICVYNYNNSFNNNATIKVNYNGEEKWLKNKDNSLLGIKDSSNYKVKSSLKLYSTYKLEKVAVDLKPGDIFNMIGYQNKLGLVKYKNKYYYIEKPLSLTDENIEFIEKASENNKKSFKLDLKIIIIIGVTILFIIILIIVLVIKKKKRIVVTNTVVNTNIIPNTQIDSSNINNNNI